MHWVKAKRSLGESACGVENYGGATVNKKTLEKGTHNPPTRAPAVRGGSVRVITGPGDLNPVDRRTRPDRAQVSRTSPPDIRRT